MEKYYYSNCSCPKQGHHSDNDLNHNNCSCNLCCTQEICCSCSLCRKDLCSTNFKIRLAGLQDGLNFRLRKQLWRKAEFELNNGNKVKGTIVFVGFNFVEILIDNSFSLEDGDKEWTKKPPVEEKEHDGCEKRKHIKGRTWIFSIDKIANVKLSSS